MFLVIKYVISKAKNIEYIS